VTSNPAPPETAGPATERDTGFRYQPALDGIRALAVLAVMAYHGAYKWARGGFLGVDAFFVLSGFLITTLLVLEWRKAQTIHLVAFWGRRIRRLLPALLLVIVFVAVFAVIAMPSYELEKLRWDGLAGLFYVANWRFIIAGQSYFDLFSAAAPFRHLWSLAIEEQFYLVWPLVVLGCLRLAKGRLRVLAVVCIAGTVASVWLMDALFRADDPSRAYYGTDSRAHTLLVGCLLALLFLVWRPVTRRAQLTIQALGVVAAVTVAWSFWKVSDVDPNYYGLGSLAFAVAVAALIAAAVQPGPGPVRTPLSWAPLRWIGTISYGLYLWHWPVNIWLVHWRVGFGGSALNGLRLLVTFALATASYYLVERPIRQGRPQARTLRWVAPAGIATVGLTLLVATASAAPPPTYLGAGRHPIPCPAPSPSELRAARTALRRADTEPTVARSARGTRVLLVGDSIACSLQPGLLAVGDAAGLEIKDASAIACGIASGEVESGDIFVPPNTDECDGLMDAILDFGMRRPRPDVVLWLSTWERVDLVEDGEVLEAGTPRWEKAMLRRMERVLDRFTRAGARVLVATQASLAPAKLNTATPDEQAAQDESFVRLNQLLLKFAARHPDDVTLVDLGDHLCPGGAPCPEERDGIVVRAADGGHFSPQGGVWASTWLLPYLAGTGETATPGA
jgi:peptidoglycan/LPS O-acetylase OafA/YrhL